MSILSFLVNNFKEFCPIYYIPYLSCLISSLYVVGCGGPLCAINATGLVLYQMYPPKHRYLVLFARSFINKKPYPIYTGSRTLTFLNRLYNSIHQSLQRVQCWIPILRTLGKRQLHMSHGQNFKFSHRISWIQDITRKMDRKVTTPGSFWNT